MTGSPSAPLRAPVLHRLLPWVAGLISLALPLVFAPSLSDPFQLPKQLLFRAGFLILLGAWLGGSLASGRFQFPDRGVALPLVLVVFLAFLSIFPAANRGEAAAVARDMAFTAATFFMLASLPGAESRRRLAGAVGLSALATALLGTIQLVGGPRVTWLPSTQGGALAGDVSTAALFVALGLPLVIGLAASAPGQTGRWGWSLGAGVLIGYLVLARCRGAWLGALVALGWLGVARFVRRRAEGATRPSSGRSRQQVAAALLAAAALVAAGVYGAGISVASASPSLRTAELGGWDLRLDVWRAGMSMAVSRPLGAGAGNWPVAFAAKAGQLQPPTRFGHARLPAQAGNEYLEFAGELGLVGLVMGLWAAGWLLREGWRRSRSGADWQAASAAASLGGLAAAALLASVFRDPPVLWTATLAAALVLSSGAAGGRNGEVAAAGEPMAATAPRRRTIGVALIGLFLVLGALTSWNIIRSVTASRWLRIGQAACSQRDYALALPALARASREVEFLFPARYLSGACALEARRPDLAERQLDAARRLNPGDPATLLALSRSLQAQGKMIEAVAVAEKAASFWPHDEAVNVLLGGLRESTGNRKGAFEAYEEASVANPYSVETYLRIGDIWISRDNGFQAMGAYLKAVNLDPYFPEAVLKLGNAYLKQGDYNSAIQIYQNLLDFQPDHVEGQVNLARTYSGLRQYCDARRILERVVTQLQGSPQEAALKTALADLTSKCSSAGGS